MAQMTHEELDNVRLKIVFHGHAVMISEELLDRLIAAARASIQRPIADAPRDGTLIDVITIDGDRVPDVGFWRDHWRIPGGDEVDPLMTSGHGIGWFPIPGEGGV